MRLAPPPRETPAEIESDLENVRKELEALNEKAKVNASDPAAVIRQEDTKATAPQDVGASEIARNPAGPAQPPHETLAAIEAPAEKQSAAE